jgi:hypothetical protein
LKKKSTNPAAELVPMGTAGYVPFEYNQSKKHKFSRFLKMADGMGCSKKGDEKTSLYIP